MVGNYTIRALILCVLVGGVIVGILWRDQRGGLMGRLCSQLPMDQGTAREIVGSQSVEPSIDRRLPKYLRDLYRLEVEKLKAQGRAVVAPSSPQPSLGYQSRSFEGVIDKAGIKTSGTEQLSSTSGAHKSGKINEATSTWRRLTCCDAGGHYYARLTDSLIIRNGQYSADGGQTFLNERNCVVDFNPKQDALDDEDPAEGYQACGLALAMTKGTVPRGSMYGQ